MVEVEGVRTPSGQPCSESGGDVMRRWVMVGSQEAKWRSARDEERERRWFGCMRAVRRV